MNAALARAQPQVGACTPWLTGWCVKRGRPLSDTDGFAKPQREEELCKSSMPRAGDPKAWESGADLVKPSQPPSPMLATAGRSCASELGKAKVCKARPSGRCGGFAERGFATQEALPGANGNSCKAASVPWICWKCRSPAQGPAEVGHFHGVIAALGGEGLINPA